MSYVPFIIVCLCETTSLAADPLGPGSGPWEVETPAAHGLDADLLDAAKDRIWQVLDGATNASSSRDCLVIVKDGALVYEHYGSNEYNNTGHEAFSLTKTLGALIAGWAATHDNLDIDKDISATYGVPSPKSYPVTSRQIMSQALGGDDGPGEAWKYDASGNDWINHMARVVLSATGKNTSQIWMKEFQLPLGLSEEFAWPNADSAWAYGSIGTCRDYARIMQLMLNRGKWKGVNKPIVSASFVKEMVTPQTKYEPYAKYSNPCYGLLTWLHADTTKYPGSCLVPLNTSLDTQRQDWFPEGSPFDIFSAQGMGGHVGMVVPEQNAVVISMGHNSDPEHVFPVLYGSLCKAFGGNCKSKGPAPIII